MVAGAEGGGRGDGAGGFVADEIDFVVAVAAVREVERGGRGEERGGIAGAGEVELRGELVAEARLRVGAGVEGGMAGVDMAMGDDWLQLVSSERKLA